MAAAYRLVVSTVNYYNSVVIDQRFQQAIHYCTGTCQTFRHGVDCIVVHHSVCAELLHIPVSGVKNAAHAPIFLPEENGLSLAESEENHQILPGIPKSKKVSVVQSTCNLKDIAGEAISFASGKIKEFSLEKLKNSNHVTYRKGRKVKSDSFNRRSVDFDLIFGHYGNDGNYPSFGLLRSSSLEEKPAPHSNSLETNMASLFLQNLSEENLITQILEKHKLDSPSSGTDIKMCLDILLKCSEDLKKCTDIIKQCIKKKSGSSISDGSGRDSFSSSETIYMNVMTRLASYLKKIPFEFLHPGHTENTDLTEFISNLPDLQPAPFSPIFGTEQPPKYEDVVQLAPETGQFHSVEFQEDKHDSMKTGTIKSLQTNPTKSPSNSLRNLELNDPRTMETVQLKPQTLTMNPLESVSSDFMETLYIEEESDGRKVFDKEKRTENSFNQECLEMNKAKSEFIDHNSSLEKSPTLVQAETLGRVFEKTFALSKEDSTPKVTKVEEKNHIGIMKPNNQEEIDKLLLDLECFSQRMENTLGEPLAKSCDPKSLNNHNPLVGQTTLDLEPKSNDSSPLQKSPSSSLTRIIENNGHKIEEEDRALLLRILESIEDFAQELVECKSGRGSLSQEKEMMQILQETLTTSSQARSSVCQNHTSDKTKDSPAVVLIQQSPEVIKVQNKQEKKHGTPLVPAASVGSSPRPLSPLLHVNNVASNVPLSINIPRFYFPKGLPDACANHEQTINSIEMAFTEVEDQKADIYEMGKIAKACGCPFYWKAPMFSAAGGERTGFVSVHSFVAMWRKLLYNCHDDASKFVYLLAKPNCNCLEQEDFIPLLQDVVDTHPGLTFLKDAPEFHSRYITTVIQRIFYTVNRSWTGKITLTELRKSNFLQTLALLEEEEDINQITDYFSYEHFYVIYCKFWELDSDHDLYINQTDLSRYNDQASSNRIIERIFSGAVTRGNVVQKEGRMSYADFVWFLISEEDKRNLTSIEYWFRCMDLDGDGVLSMYELEYFYEEQCERMEAMGIEPLPFHDLLCQMLDLVKPELDGKITLRDLKRCRMAHIFYDTFFNLEKYLDHEQRDPFAVQKDVENDSPEPSDWDRYAAEEYEILVAEESANEQLQEGSFEDYDADEPVPPSELGNKGDKIVISSLSEKCGKLHSVDEE
ncbi:serine/threonine-protein phosphatase 2A regulatory subunit B'' subunit alpha isoform X1 [Trichosurus vulpecula]|uniref:serine/threonine-protein phosphatase 2A regulatory subunit B'' subunit alpha isoform X1 n=1 Tax=Trichosurus vulpecula TaxID=9337 RepID=UPI00186B38E7|nr:serine/threonine-protein phosphatase 2A regulatory subunit B'' subunit alpha isoform X1 [Trichosurus vulpecula]